jgi:hypothetical protein
MHENVPNDATIRAYLLGQMESEVLIDRIDELMLDSEEFSENVDVIEDEIIEEYVEGILSPAEKEAVESHFLRPLERQRKLEQARLLNRCFAAAQRNSRRKAQKASRERYMPFSVLSQSRLQFGMYVGTAAILLLTLLSGYLFWSRRQLQAEVFLSNQKLVQEREHSSSLSQEFASVAVLSSPLPPAAEFAPAPSVLLSLVQPGIRRGDTTLPALRIGAATTNIHVEIALPPARRGDYDVRLEAAGEIAWHRDRIQALSSSAGAILMFDVPAQVFAVGEGSFVIGQKGEIETYSFTTSRR